MAGSCRSSATTGPRPSIVRDHRTPPADRARPPDAARHRAGPPDAAPSSSATTGRRPSIVRDHRTPPVVRDHLAPPSLCGTTGRLGQMTAAGTVAVKDEAGWRLATVRGADPSNLSPALAGRGPFMFRSRRVLK